MPEESTMTIDEQGNKLWKNSKGELHRLDGPALIRTDGTKSWWANGRRHRTDGPAIENDKGYKEWWNNGQLHNTNGPAIEYSDGTKEWRINGQEISQEIALSLQNSLNIKNQP